MLLPHRPRRKAFDLPEGASLTCLTPPWVSTDRRPALLGRLLLCPPVWKVRVAWHYSSVTIVAGTFPTPRLLARAVAGHFGLELLHRHLHCHRQPWCRFRRRPDVGGRSASVASACSGSSSSSLSSTGLPAMAVAHPSRTPHRRQQLSDRHRPLFKSRRSRLRQRRFRQRRFRRRRVARHRVHQRRVRQRRAQVRSASAASIGLAVAHARSSRN